MKLSENTVEVLKNFSSINQGLVVKPGKVLRTISANKAILAEAHIDEEFKTEFKQYALNFREADHVEQAIAEADVILVEPVVQPDYTQARQEASKDKSLTPANYKITRELLMSKAKSNAILLHSLPRMDEIPPEVDITKWSRYWQEAFNGVVMRMALLALVLGAVE